MNECKKRKEKKELNAWTWPEKRRREVQRSAAQPILDLRQAMPVSRNSHGALDLGEK